MYFEPIRLDSNNNYIMDIYHNEDVTISPREYKWSESRLVGPLKKGENFFEHGVTDQFNKCAFYIRVRFNKYELDKYYLNFYVISPKEDNLIIPRNETHPFLLSREADSIEELMECAFRAIKAIFNFTVQNHEGVYALPLKIAGVS